MIILPSYGVHFYRPQSYASNDVLVDGTASPSYQDLPDLDQALSIIDQQILTLLDIYIGQDQDRITDLIIVDINEDVTDAFDQPHNLQSLHFYAKAVVTASPANAKGFK